MKTNKITAGAILKSESGAHGFGLFGHEVRRPSFWTDSADPYGAAKLIDETVADLANKREWDEQKTFEFMDSKLGRWAGDEITDLKSKNPTDKEISVIVDKYMTKFGG